MQKISMGLLCPLLMLIPGKFLQAQTWKQSYAINMQNIEFLNGISARGNTFLAYAIDGNGTTATIVKSADGGKTYTTEIKYDKGNVMSKPADSVFITAVPAIYNDKIFFAGTKNGIYKSTLSGFLYSPVYRKEGLRVETINFFGDVGIALATPNSGTMTVLRSSDAGAKWSEVNMPAGFVASNITTAGSNLFLFHWGNKSWYKSTNNGADWGTMPDLPTPLTGFYSQHINFLDASTGYLSIQYMDAGKTYFYKTTNGGQSWREIHTENQKRVPFYVKSASDIMLHVPEGKIMLMDSSGMVNTTPIDSTDKILTMFTTGSSVRYAIAEDAIGKLYVYTTAFKSTGMAKTTQPLSANTLNIYPNPCENEYLQVNYTLTDKSNTAIYITDLSGKYILSEDLGSQPAGKYHLNVNVGHLVQGIYILEVKNALGSQYQKIIIK